MNKIKMYCRKYILLPIKGNAICIPWLNKYGQWGYYELNVSPVRRRIVFIIYNAFMIIDGLVGVITLGSYCTGSFGNQLTDKFRFNRKVEKWQNKENK